MKLFTNLNRIALIAHTPKISASTILSHKSYRTVFSQIAWHLYDHFRQNLRLSFNFWILLPFFLAMPSTFLALLHYTFRIMEEERPSLSIANFLKKSLEYAYFNLIAWIFLLIEFYFWIFAIPYLWTSFNILGKFLCGTLLGLNLISFLLFFWLLGFYIYEKKLQTSLKLAMLSFFQAPVFTLILSISLILLSVLLLMTGIGLILIPMMWGIGIRIGMATIVNYSMLKKISIPPPWEHIWKPWLFK